MPRTLPHGFASMPLVRSYAYWRKGVLYRVEVRGKRGFMVQATFCLLDTETPGSLPPTSLPPDTSNPGA